MISKGYKKILITVGPFMYARHLLALKKDYPDVKLYLDIRDPWTNNKTAFGYSTLSSERFRFEKEAEKAVALGYDKIITVADNIGNYFIKEYNIPLEKVMTIKNGYDTEDFKHLSSESESKKVLIFTGNLYEKAENSFLTFVRQLEKMKKAGSDFFNHYECHFYGEIHPSFKNYFSPALNLYFYGKIPLSSVFEKISRSAACLLFLTDDLNFSFSTKFYEYLSQKKPIIVYSTPGMTGNFVEEHNLGKQADGENLQEIIRLIESNSFYRNDFDISEFEVKNLTKRFLDFLDFHQN